MKILDLRSLLALGLFVLAPTSAAFADDQAGQPKGLQIVVYRLNQARNSL